MTNKSVDTEVILQTAIDSARRAGEILKAYFADLSTAEVTSKTSERGYEGIVTKADVEAEASIIEMIRSQFPDHHFLAEESSAQGAEMGDDVSGLWVIDPLDGTNNFAHGIPHFAVSIAYYDRGQPIVGVVFQPETDQLFRAVTGQGAFVDRNGETKSAGVNLHEQLAETMIGVGFYYDRGEMMRSTLAAVERLFGQQIHGIRRMGTAALDIVQVGMGQFGAFFEYQLSPWDFAAARLFLEEAGGKITDCQGAALELKRGSVLATNGKLHPSMLSCVGDYLHEASDSNGAV